MKKSDEFQLQIDQLNDEWNNMRRKIEALKSQQRSALEDELPDVMPLIQSTEWELHDLTGLSLENDCSNFELHAWIKEDDPIAQLLSKRSGIKIKKICDGVHLKWLNLVKMELEIDLGSVVKNAEWCFDNAIHVKLGRDGEEAWRQCSEGIDALKILLGKRDIVV